MTAEAELPETITPPGTIREPKLFHAVSVEAACESNIAILTFFLEEGARIVVSLPRSRLASLERRIGIAISNA